MSAVIIEHVNVSDLPTAWRARLPAPPAARVTVRIEEETQAATPAAPQSGLSGEDILSGMWRDREDMADVDAWLRKTRAPRYNRDGSRNPG